MLKSVQRAFEKLGIYNMCVYKIYVCIVYVYVYVFICVHMYIVYIYDIIMIM